MNKKADKKDELTKQDLAKMLGGFSSDINSKIDNLGKKVDTLDKTLNARISSLENSTKDGFEVLDNKIGILEENLTARISSLENYTKEGFEILDNKIDHVDARLSHQIEGLGNRIDDLADNKISRVFFKELENRVVALELKVLPKAKK